MSKGKILIVDDEQVQRDIMGDVLENAGYQIEKARNFDEAMAVLHNNDVDLVLTDLRMPGRDGIDVLREAKAVKAETEIIMMTAHGTIANAVQAMKLGASDYLTKPFDVDELLITVDRCLERKRLASENVRFKEMVADKLGLGNMVGDSPQMQALFRIVAKAVQVDSTILIEGESGTGKELVARSIHFGGARSHGPLVVVNCAAVPASLVESELFGHEKGAFTGAAQTKKGKFELAHGGSIFLDEIGDMPLDIQPKLLRVIEEKKIERVGGTKQIPADARVIAATNRDLAERVKAGAFREDLFFRLNVIPIRIPPLRERMEDIPCLVEHFRKKLADRFKRPFPPLDRAVIDRFMSYHWPGNVRELENTMERMMILAEGDRITAGDLPPALQGSKQSEPSDLAASGASLVTLPDSGVQLEEVEKDLISQAVQKSGGNLKRAAKLLGITYKTLQYRVKKYGEKAKPRTHTNKHHE